MFIESQIIVNKITGLRGMFQHSPKNRLILMLEIRLMVSYVPSRMKSEDIMFKIFRKLGQSNEMLDKFYSENPFEALAEYRRLGQIRTEGAGCVLLIEDSTQIGYYRTNMTWPDEAREHTDLRHWIYGLDLEEYQQARNQL